MASPKGMNLGLLIALVMMIFLALGAIAIAVSFNSDLDAQAKVVVGLKEDVETKDQDLIRIKKDYQEVNELVWGRKEPVDVNAFRKNYLDRAHLVLKEILDQEQYGGLSQEFMNTLKADSKLTSAKARVENKAFTQVDEVFAVYERIVASLVPELNGLRAARTEADGRRKQQSESATKTERGLKDEIATLRTEKGRIENEKIQLATKKEEEIRELLEEKEEIQNQAAEKAEEMLVVLARRESKINELEQRIQEMKEHRERSLADTDADGEVVYSNHRLGKAWIDLGRDDALRRGLTFEVFQYIKGGKRKRKGIISVKRVEDDHAECAVLVEHDPADPIVKGDQIASPFYDKKKEMVFVFVGEKLANDRYEREQLKRRIEDFGGRVDEKVSIDTDFVVAIQNAEQYPEFTRAVQYGTIIMREQELLDFIGQ